MEQVERLDDVVGWPEAEAIDPVIERYKQDIDISLLEKNLGLTTQQRAQQLLNAVNFIKKFRPLVQGGHNSDPK